jgi:hypothetical protein
MNDFEARVNVTWAGQNGDLPDPVSFDASDGAIREWAAEAIRTGTLPGIVRDRGVDLRDFVVDRFPASPDNPVHRIFLRPKTPFGAR